MLQIRALFRLLLPVTGSCGYGSESPVDGAMRECSTLAFAILLIAAGSASAMEPLQLSSSVVDRSGSPAAGSAVSQEQASLDASCRQLRAQAGSVDQPLLEQGPRHPQTSHLLNVGF